MVKDVVEARQTYIEASKVTINQYTSGQENRLIEHKWTLAVAVSESCVSPENVKIGLDRLGEGAGSTMQARTGLADGTGVKSPGADWLVCNVVT